MKSAIHRIRNLPIRRKLTLVILITCSIVLILAATALLIFQSISIKSQSIQDISRLGRIIAQNSAAAAAFNDHDAAAHILSTLKGRAEIVGACLKLANGEHVVRFDRDHERLTESSISDGYLVEGTDALFASPVMLDGKPVGTLYLRADFGPSHASLLKFYCQMLGSVLIVSLLVAYFIAGRLQRFITGPILHLAQVLQGVGEHGDYSVRATKVHGDEVGKLTDSFNEMLDQIEQRDSALQSAHGELEKRVERRTKQLASSLSLLNATLEATADGVVSLDLEGKITSCNSKFVDFWGFPSEMVERRDTAEMVEFSLEQTKDPIQFIERLKLHRADPQLEMFDLVELKDGRTFERYARPQFVGSECAGTVLSYRDITARVQAEQRMSDLNQQLVDVSRQAGMAEIASSVLHNVGNVLNSVGTSISVASAKVSEVKVDALAQVSTLLTEHAGDLPAFFAGHPQGMRLPKFLAQLTTHFTKEQKAILAELELLRGNFEHINEIVAMQQSYAGAGGVVEAVRLSDIIENALRMNTAAFKRHGTEVVREFDPALPLIPLDRNKLLLILVNLVRNAKYACDDGGQSEKRITVRTQLNGDRMARILVSDNGIGISRENLTRIFAHGFTTRKGGHGFGLHSSALAAKEMGGAIRVSSDGPGAGATFIVELPVQSMAA